MSKTRDTGYLNNIIKYTESGNITFVNGNTTLLSISSSGAITTTGVISGSSAESAISASYAQVATSASQAQNAVSSSFAANAANATSASFALNAANAVSASQAQNAVSSSFATNASSSNLLDGKDSTEFAITGSNIFTGTQYTTDTINPNGFGASASVYTDGGVRITKDAYVSGTIYVNNLTVFGTQSINYITSSQLNISTNIISVNTDTPSIRFGGLSVYDSGSTGLTGSMLWDSERDHWVYSNPSGSSYSGGMLMSGPRSSALGSEQGTLNNFVMKGQGGDHITSSQIIDDGTTVRIPGNLQVTGSLNGSSAVFSSNIRANAASTIYGATQDTIQTIFTLGGQNASAQAKELYFRLTAGGTPAWTLQTAAVGTDTDINIYPNGNNGLKIAYAGAATFSSTVTATSLSTGNSGLSVSGYGFLTQTVSGQMTILGHNVAASPSVTNQVNVVNGGWYSSMIRQYYNEGITFHTSDTVYSAGAVYPMTSTERMRITSGGNVGIGTSSPATSLMISKTLASNQTYLTLDNKTNSKYNWGIDWAVLDSTNIPVAAIRAIYPADNDISLGFYTYNGSGNVTERMRITSGGELYWNLTGVSGGSLNGGGVLFRNNSGKYVQISTGVTFDTGLIYFYKSDGAGSVTNTGSIATSGNSTVYNTTSDYRLKQDFQDYNGLRLISKIKTYDYEWKSDKTRMFGVIAHELAEVLPYAVTGKKDAEEMQSVDYSKLVPILVKAIQELKAEIDILKAQ